MGVIAPTAMTLTPDMSPSGAFFRASRRRTLSDAAPSTGIEVFRAFATDNH